MENACQLLVLFSQEPAEAPLCDSYVKDERTIGTQLQDVVAPSIVLENASCPSTTPSLPQ